MRIRAGALHSRKSRGELAADVCGECGGAKNQKGRKGGMTNENQQFRFYFNRGGAWIGGGGEQD